MRAAAIRSGFHLMDRAIAVVGAIAFLCLPVAVEGGLSCAHGDAGFGLCLHGPRGLATLFLAGTVLFALLLLLWRRLRASRATAARQRHELAARTRVLDAILTTLDLDPLLGQILEEARVLLQADCGALYVRAGTRLVPRACRSARAESCALLMSAPAEAHLVRPVPKGVLRDPGAQGGVIADFAAREQVRACVWVPLVAPPAAGTTAESDGAPIGGILLGSRQPDALGREHVETLHALAIPITLAILRADDHRRVRQTLEQLRATQEQAIRQVRLRALGQMAGGIAHDFNNALMPVLGFTDLLLDNPALLADAVRGRAYLQHIHQAAMDAREVVRRLRELYRRREEGETFVPVRLDLLVQEAIRLTEPKWSAEARAAGREIAIDNEVPALPPIAGNVVELREVLTNLILNSVDAMPAGGTLRFRCRPEGDRVVLEVQDTGVGMAEEVRRHCFEPFYTTKGDQGTGLGLAMVHGILERHGGSIAVESRPGRGATFVIGLPIAPAGMRDRLPAPHAPAAPPAQSLKVLLVDDDPQARATLAAYLQGDGHDVTTAASGREGLERFHSGRFDLVITDLAMPEMSGDRLAAAIRASAPGKPILLLTGFGDQLGGPGDPPPKFDRILAKPVALAEFRDAVATLTRGNHATSGRVESPQPPAVGRG